jgi:hypothetical protein
MPVPADRRSTERMMRMMSYTRLDQIDIEETIRRAREVRAEARQLIEHARQVRETAAIITGVRVRSDLRDTSP